MIVNADDFGRSPAHNAAIGQALSDGLVTSASLMATLEGFEEGATAAGGHPVGVHLVLTEGEPLTNPIRRLRRFCDDDGRFFEWRVESGLVRLSAQERSAVEAEWRAQVERVRAARIAPAHLDSHHHVHTEWPLAGIAIRIARDLGVPRVRIGRNCGPGLGLGNLAYKKALNARLRRAGLAGTSYFGNAGDWLHLKAGGASAAELDDFEVMVHPVLDADRRLLEEQADRPLTALLASLGRRPPSRDVPAGAQ